MINRLVLILMVALDGAGLALQMAWNARLRTATNSPVLTTIISVLATLVSLVLVWASGATDRGTIPTFQSLPKWAWFGGFFAAYYLVASLIGIPKLGAAAVFSLVITGQMVGALALDSMAPLPWLKSRSVRPGFWERSYCWPESSSCKSDDAPGHAMSLGRQAASCRLPNNKL